MCRRRRGRAVSAPSGKHAVHSAGAEPCQLVRADGGNADGHASLCAGDDGAALPGTAAGAGESVSFKYGLRAAHAVHGGGGDAARVARALAARVQPQRADALEGFVAGDANGRGRARFRPGEYRVRAGQSRADGGPAAEALRALRPMSGAGRSSARSQGTTPGL